MDARRGVMEGSLPEEAEPEEPQQPPTPPAPAAPSEDSGFDPNEPLFDGGPTHGIVDAWKGQFGKVYVTSFAADEHYIWRTISRFEYRRLVKQLEQAVASGQVSQAEANMNNEEAICELTLLYPQINRADIGGIPAGVASIIAQEVMEASAFVASEVREL